MTVKTSPTSPNYTVKGWLCGDWKNPNRTVQLTLSGASYSHVYFDFPYKFPKYSYVHLATERGYVTFNIDRLGIGESSYPPDQEVGIPSEAFVTHQIVQSLRNGQVTGNPVPKVMLVTHSLGALIGAYEASTYHDVDGLVLSGWLHNFNPALTSEIAGPPPLFVPAQSEGITNRPLGYQTTVSGRRGTRSLYYPPGVDPQVVAVDEATKQTLTSTELADFGQYASMQQTVNIHVPVLIDHGGQDMNCQGGSISACTPDLIRANEQPYYAPDTCLQIDVIPNAGHDVLLHLTGPSWRSSVLNWADQYVGTDTSSPAINQCP
ncbi:alpha/beta fold hydrolase [Streptomyces sp. NPDC001139]